MIIGLDVGGTHTDVVLLGEEGLVRQLKVPTASEDLFGTVLDGLERVTAGISPKELRRIVLSTTLTTNAIVQDKLPEVGMIVSSGPGIDPALFRTNAHFYPVAGVIDHRGREVESIDPDEIKKVAAALRRDGIRYAGIVGKFSVRNPGHELQIAELLGAGFEKIFMGHRISGNLAFPRRIATTYLNAAVYPVHRQFYQAVERSLASKGLLVPIHILKADGGTMSFEASIDFPGQSILSGPAASVMGSIAFAPARDEALALDIGGTTTDIAVLVDRVPVLDPLGIRLGRYRTLIRSLKTLSVGLGGDSLVRVENDELIIGPERCGPPMAYGGARPTPTDALLVMGKIDSGDRARAAEGIATIAGALGISTEAAARRIFDESCRRIWHAAGDLVSRINRKAVYTVHELQEGYQVKPQQLLVLGGPAPHFAGRLGELAGLPARVIPRWEVANAIGAALARTTCEVTLFADTEQGIVLAPEEDFRQRVAGGFGRDEALTQACELLRAKALRTGARDKDLEVEVLEDLQFNMVRGFFTTGQNIRIKVQVKPGLIKANEAVARMLAGAEAA